MNTAFQYVLSMSLAASILVCAVILFRLLFKKAPRYIMCILWAIVGLRLICPITLESSLSLIPEFLSPSDGTVISGGTVEIPDKAPIQSEGPNAGQQPGVPSNPETNGEINVPQSPSGNVQITAPKSEIDLLEVCSVVWLCGAAAMIAYTCISYALLCKRVATSVRVDGNVYECDDIDSPFILGVFNPKIYLPSELSDGREHVIAHERAHIKRLDHVWKPLGFLILSVYWFNPVIWLAYVLLCRDIELACDERVIGALSGDGKREYSTALLSCSVQRKMISACPLAFGETDVKQRIKSVLSYKKPALWLIIGAVAVSLIITVCFATMPHEKGVPFFSSRVRSVSADNATLSLSDDGRLSFALSSKSYTTLYLPANAMTLEAEAEDGWAAVNDAISEVTENADLFTLIERGNDYTVECSLNPEVPLTDGTRYRLVTTAYRHYPTRGTAQPTSIYVEFTYAGGKISTEKSYVYNLPTGENTVRFDAGDYEFFTSTYLPTTHQNYVLMLDTENKTFSVHSLLTGEKLETEPKSYIFYEGTYTKVDDEYSFTSYNGEKSGKYIYEEESGRLDGEGTTSRLGVVSWLPIKFNDLNYPDMHGKITIDLNGDGVEEDYILSGNTDMKRIVLEAKNNYDELFESIKDLCFPTVSLPTYEEKLPRYADFSSKCPHPVFAKDVHGKYFIVTEERSTVHKYSFIYNNDTLELTENGKKPPMSDAIGRSTKYVCSYLPGYENTKATIITHSGYGIVIKIEGKKDVTVRGTYLINLNEDLIVYAEDGKRYIFEDSQRRVSPTTNYLSLSASSPDNMMGDYHIPYFTVFNIMHFDPYESFSEGVYKFTDSNGNDNLISIYSDGSALAEAYYNGEKHVLNGFYTQTGKRLALSVIIDHEIHTAYFDIQNNSFSIRMYGEGDPPTSIFEVLSQPGIEYTKTKAKLKQNPQKSKKYFCPTDDPTVLHTVEIFESGTVLLYSSKSNRYYASSGHLTEINNELHVTSKSPISYLIFRKNDDGSLTLTFADISDGQNVSYITGSTFQRYD